MLDFFWNVAAFIIALGTLIMVHEFGHFITARYYGVMVERFSIGFGKILWRYYDKKNTEYVISVIPLGGYVKMLDEQINTTKSQHDYSAFNQKKIWQRALIVFAGPLFNLLFSVVLYWIVFVVGFSSYRPIIKDIIPNSVADQMGMSPGTEIKFIDDVVTSDWYKVKSQLIDKIGQKEVSIGTSFLGSSSIKKYVIDLRNRGDDFDREDPILSLGILASAPQIESILTKIYPGSVAMKMGLQVGDKVVAIDNQLVDNNWQIFATKVKNSPGKMLKISIERAGSLLDINLTPDKNILIDGTIEGCIGVVPKIIPSSMHYNNINRLGLLDAFNQAILKSWQMIDVTVNMLGKLIVGDVGLSGLSGPISIAQGAGLAAEYGWNYYFMFLAMISINLGIINLLPLPVLDGGHLLFLIIEKFNGQAISLHVQDFSYRVGFILLVLLMCLAIFNDLSRFC
ncbi:sigma E protease regulator RseP [Blochmannia endosymbiont of Camponotus (Colobopsis) obliquus]|uniref:sigma E protease regulator RseP n=1 Tax=Blochmannia endosymbiont of Camponotus (Colobopsis) obliquus TaxID=1505597 RepID=UPI00061A8A99|nr:sigma E protease regulator RseP [Blochmannia endosymbiont of Camponotus (Colobopsis) obliquus]AKC60444.1 Regulator of sigma E protease [Blochmannia endosymbiont of Camponotus (Colobopsis) obliquus]